MPSAAGERAAGSCALAQPLNAAIEVVAWDCTSGRGGGRGGLVPSVKHAGSFVGLGTCLRDHAGVV